jgi:hypothetical protein
LQLVLAYASGFDTSLTIRILAHARHKFALPQSFSYARHVAASENE